MAQFVASALDSHKIHPQSAPNSGNTIAVSILICTNVSSALEIVVQQDQFDKVHIVLAEARQLDLSLLFGRCANVSAKQHVGATINVFLVIKLYVDQII